MLLFINTTPQNYAPKFHITQQTKCLVTNPKGSEPLTTFPTSAIGFHLGQCFIHFRLLKSYSPREVFGFLLSSKNS